MKSKKKRAFWTANLKNQGIDVVKAGNLKIKQSKPCRKCRESQEILQEKGVDVRIAVDILAEAYDGPKNNQIALFSSDTDLCPALHQAKEKKLRVTYVCFADSINRAVAAVAGETVAISTEKVKKYYSGK